MAEDKPLHQAAVGQNNTVAQAQGYLSYIGETRVYFLLPNLGWRLYFNLDDQALKMQILTAFANPSSSRFSCFIREPLLTPCRWLLLKISCPRPNPVGWD